MVENWMLLTVFVAANLVAAVSGSFFKPGAWYKSLNKPVWTPPNWLFPLAWGALYLLIAYAGYRFTIDTPPDARLWPLVLYATQLILNAAWSPLFFGARKMNWALVDIIAMIVAIGGTIFAFHDTSPVSALLLVPYFIWVCFACALNFSIMSKNSERRDMER